MNIMEEHRRMKKIVIGLLTVVLAACCLFGCSSKNESEEDTSLQDVQDKKELVLGLDASFPPMGFTDENQEIVGFDIDLAKEVADRMGVELKLQPINWDSKEQELDTGNIDCIWNGLTYSEDRAEVMLCSEPYMENHQVLVVPADSSIKSLDDVKDKSVGVQEGSTAADAVDKTDELKDADIVLLPDNVQILNDLGNGCDAAVMDEVVAKYYTEQDNGKYKVLAADLATEDYVIGFRKEDQALCDEVEKQLKDMAEDGKLAEISEKWFGEDITTIK